MPISGGNRWTDFVRSYARHHNISYMCALSTPDCSASYKAGKQGEPKTRKEKKANAMMSAEDRPAPDRKEALGDIFESATPISGVNSPAVRQKLKNRGSLQKALENKQREHAQMSAEDRDAPEAPKSPPKAKKARKSVGRPRKYATVEEARIANIKQTAERKKAKTQARVGKGRKSATVSASFSRPYNADVGDPNPLNGGYRHYEPTTGTYREVPEGAMIALGRPTGGIANPFDWGYKIGHDIVGPALFGRGMSGGIANPFDWGYKIGHDIVGPALFGRGEGGYMSGGDWLSAIKGIGHALGKPFESIPVEALVGLGYRMTGGDWLSAITGVGHALGKPFELIPAEKLIGLGYSGGMELPSFFEDDANLPAGVAYPQAPQLTQEQIQQIQNYLNYMANMRGTPSRIPRKPAPPKKRGGMVNPFADSHAIIGPESGRPPFHTLPYPPRRPPVREAPNIIGRRPLGSDPRTWSPYSGGSVFGDYSSLIKHLVGHITDPKEPIDPKDFAGAKKLITGIEKVKKAVSKKGGVRIGPVPKNTFVGMNQQEY